MGTIKFKDNKVKAGVGFLCEDTSNVSLKETNSIDKKIKAKVFDDVAILYEDTAKRGENTATFIKNNGTTNVVYSNNAIHYLDSPSNTYKKIDCSLVENSKTILNKTNLYGVTFHKKSIDGKIFEIEKNNCKISLSSLCLQSRQNCCLEQEYSADECGQSIKDAVIIKDFQENADIEYIVESNKLKENIIVKAVSESYTYDFKLNINNLEVSLSEDAKNIKLINKKTQVVEFTIPAPFMFDANNVYSNDVIYDINYVSDNELSFNVIASADFINMSERVFPVTIDPEIIVNSGLLFTGTVYYKMPEDDVWDNFIGNATFINVTLNDYQIMKTEITVNRSSINILPEELISAKLKLKQQGTSSGWFTVNGARYYADGSSNTTDIDLTNFIKGTSNLLSFMPESNNMSVAFYATGEFAPVLSLTYLNANKRQPPHKSFDLAGVATGDLNLKTGELVTTFCDVSGADSIMGIGISHVYKKDEKDFSCGKYFRLNLHETLVKNTDSTLDENYFYTDSTGEKYGFKEEFYYLGTYNEKVTIPKNAVEIDLEHNLTYEGKKVYKELITLTGLKIISKLENFKNVNLIEQRQEEFKHLEEQVTLYTNNLNELVLMDTSNGEIKSYYKNYVVVNPDFDSYLSSVTSSSMVLTESEAIGYKSMKLQYDSMGLQYDSMGLQVDAMGLQDASMEYQIDAMGLNDVSMVLQDTSMGLNDVSMVLQDTSMDLQKESFDLQNTHNIYLIDNEEFQSENWFFYNGTNINLNSQKNNINGQKSNLSNQRSNLSSQRTNLSNQRSNLSSQKTNLSNQRSNVSSQKINLSQVKNNTNHQKMHLSDQIAFIINKKSLYISNYKNLYKEYVNRSFELSKMKKQMPVNFITDSKIIKGFNNDGDLVTIYDNYRNSAIIEYDVNGRISRIYDGEERQVVLDYSASGLLSSITDSRGRKTSYSYTDNRLTNIKFGSGKSARITYYNYYPAVIWQDMSVISLIQSSDELQAVLGYDGGLTSITNRSSTSNISHNHIVAGDIISSNVSIFYPTGSKTILSDNDGNNEFYYFDGYGNNCEYRLEENGLITKAEKYDFISYSHKKVEYAKKDSLNKTVESGFVFVGGDYDLTTLNQFNNPSKVETNARKINDNSTAKTETVYFYDNDQKCEMTITKLTTVTPSGSKTYYNVSKNFYNAQGDIVRTENFTTKTNMEQETQPTIIEYENGIEIQETFYDEKGNQTKSVSYNSLDTSSKFYQTHEIIENGQTTAEIDETGENKTVINYIDGTNIVESRTLPNGSKFAYGRDIDDTITAITQSTEDGDANSTQTHYTCGVVTEITSGNNLVNYEYDHKRRITKVGLNGNDEYLKYNYVSDEDIIATNAKDEVFETITDKKGNILQTKYGNIAQITCTYENDKLKTLTDGVSNYLLTNTYDGFDRVASVTKDSAIVEEYEYNEYSSLITKKLTNDVDHTYKFNYKNDSTRQIENIQFKGLTISAKNDTLNRQSEKIIFNDYAKILGEYYYYSKHGDHATNRISGIRYGSKVADNYAITDGLKYAYDNVGNISKVYENGQLQVSYTYDKLSRIAREDNRKNNKTLIFNYDNNGNILTRFESGYTIKPLDEIPNESIITYSYSYESNSDRLLRITKDINSIITEENFVYDSIGNPTTYRGKTLSWTKGRQMMSYNGEVFAYNGQGQRASKGDITFTYDSSGKLIKQSNRIEFIYDNNGVCGFINGGTYLYRKNVQGDIIAILDSSGAIKAKYTYDAWGNHKVYNPDGTENTTDAFIGNINPIRYRSYYYDTETGWYLLSTRYYDPEIGRFINADDISYLDPESINGLNLYSYCLNNPIMMVDYDGHAPEWWQWLIGGIGAALVITAAALAIFATGGAAAFGIGALIGSLSLGAVGAGVGGYIGYQNGGIEGMWQGALIGFGIGAAVGFVAGGFAGLALQQAGIIGTKVPLSSIANNPLDEFMTLGPKAGQIAKYARSIAETGNYGKIFVTKLAKGIYQIANGHHRFAALAALGYKIVKVFITK